MSNVISICVEHLELIKKYLMKPLILLLILHVWFIIMDTEVVQYV